MKKRTTWGFLGILTATLGASLLGNMLREKGVLRAVKESSQGTIGAEKGVLRASEDTIRAG